MPVQAIGVSLKGVVPSGKFGLNYLFEYGSSDTMRTRLDGTGSIPSILEFGSFSTTMKRTPASINSFGTCRVSQDLSSGVSSQR